MFPARASLAHSAEIWGCWPGWSGPASVCLGWLATMQLRATLSNSFWISGAQCTNSWDQNLKVGFLISSIKVMRRPQGCGLFTISLSSKTLEIRFVLENHFVMRRVMLWDKIKGSLVRIHLSRWNFTLWFAPGWPPCWPQQTGRGGSTRSSGCGS